MSKGNFLRHKPQLLIHYNTIFLFIQQRRIVLENFKLIPGNFISDIASVTEGYCFYPTGAVCSVSAEHLEPLAVKAVNILKKPLFFFMEIPCTEEEEKCLGEGLHKNVYYLDNCTKEVCLAIIERYRHLLFTDGYVEFGFGSADDEEIYFRKYQNVSIITEKTNDFRKAFTELGIKNMKNITFAGDVICPENPGYRQAVEAEGEDIYTMLANLKEVGMYFSHTADDE